MLYGCTSCPPMATGVFDTGCGGSGYDEFSHSAANRAPTGWTCPDLQQRVLEFVNALALSQRKGPPGKQLLRFAGTISDEDAQAMLHAVAESCERVDTDDACVVVKQTVRR